MNDPVGWQTWVIGGLGWLVILAAAGKFVHWAATRRVIIPIEGRGLWRDPVYRRNREVVMRRYGRRCAMCGSTDRVEMHHIRSRSAGGGHEISNLIPLCHAHHEYIHGRRFGSGAR